MKNKFGIFAIINYCDFELKSTHDILEDAVSELNASYCKDGMYFIMPIFIKDDEAKREKEYENKIEFLQMLKKAIKIKNQLSNDN